MVPLLSFLNGSNERFTSPCPFFTNRYKFVNYPRLRTPSDYSKGSLLHKKREAERMLEWQVRAMSCRVSI